MFLTGHKRPLYQVDNEVDGYGETKIETTPKQQPKRPRIQNENLEKKETELTSLLFGDEEEIIEDLGTETRDFVIDKKPDKIIPDAPAWIDEYSKQLKIKTDDGEYITGDAYEELLRQSFERINKTPKWTKIEHQDSKENDLFNTTEQLIDYKNTLKRGELDVAKLKDVNLMERPFPQKQVVGVQFHPKSNLCAVMSTDNIIRLFQVDEKVNPLVEKIYILSSKQFVESGIQLRAARFTPDGHELIVTAGGPAFYTVDIVKGEQKRVPMMLGNTTSGKNLFQFDISNDNKWIAFATEGNYIKLASRQTKMIVDEFKMNTPVRQVAFSQDPNYLFSVGKAGKVYIWDLRKRRPMLIHDDEGSSDTTSIALAPNMKYYATGSTNGVVNVYKDPLEHMNRRPKAHKALMNLVTTVDQLKFNHDSQLLAMASSTKENAWRLVHVPSFESFSNFPAFELLTQTFKVSSFDFSANSNYFAIATDQRVRLYKLAHYNTL